MMGGSSDTADEHHDHDGCPGDEGHLRPADEGHPTADDRDTPSAP
jgi:hypothetical protein